MSLEGLTPGWKNYNPVRVFAGAGSFSKLRGFVPASGDLLLVTTPGFERRGLVCQVRELIGEDRLAVFDEVVPNPSLDQLDEAIGRFFRKPLSGIIALGGGSAIDSAKVLSVAIPAGLARPLERIFRNGESQRWGSRIPVVAIPTTAGTGAEVTPFATIWDQAHGKKFSVTGDLVFPEWAVLDPALTTTLPRDETLYSALDAISHALESLWNIHRTPASRIYAVEALKSANKSLVRTLENPQDLVGRAELQRAALFAGLAISQTRTAIAHSISYPITTRYGVPHGLACSFTLPVLLSRYLEALTGVVPERPLFVEILELLQRLELCDRELSKYLSREQLRELPRLKTEMITPGRSDNFAFARGEEVLDNVLEALVMAG